MSLQLSMLGIIGRIIISSQCESTGPMFPTVEVLEFMNINSLFLIDESSGSQLW